MLCTVLTPRSRNNFQIIIMKYFFTNNIFFFFFGWLFHVQNGLSRYQVESLWKTFHICKKWHTTCRLEPWCGKSMAHGQQWVSQLWVGAAGRGQLWEVLASPLRVPLWAHVVMRKGDKRTLISSAVTVVVLVSARWSARRAGVARGPATQRPRPLGPFAMAAW